MTSHHRPKAQYLFWGSVLYLAAAMGYWYGFVIDDAYIFFRYGKNLLATGEFVWNQGGEVTEGFTSLLWLLMIAPFCTGELPVIASKFLNFALAIGAALLLREIVRKLAPGNELARWIIPALFLVEPLTLIHASSGMETLLFTACLLAVYFLYLQNIHNNTRDVRQALAFSVAGMLLFLTRPEGIVALGIFGVCLLLWSPQTPQTKALALGSCVGMLGVYFLWRWSVIGGYLPNAFYVKMAHKKSLLPGLKYVVSGLVWEISPFLLLIPWGGKGLVSTRFREFLPAVLILVFMCLFYANSTPLMGFGYRFLFPFFVLCLPFLAFVITEMDGAPLRWGGVALLVFLLQSASAAKVLPFMNWYANGMSAAHIPLGKSLAKAEYETICSGDAGALAYYNDKKHIDIIGLNTNEIAREGFKADLVYKHDPDALILLSEDGETVSTTMAYGKDHALTQHPEFGRYTFKEKYVFGKRYSLLLYIRER